MGLRRANEFYTYVVYVVGYSVFIGGTERHRFEPRPLTNVFDRFALSFRLLVLRTGYWLLALAKKETKGIHFYSKKIMFWDKDTKILKTTYTVKGNL